MSLNLFAINHEGFYFYFLKVGAPAEVVARLEHAAAASISYAAAISEACEESEPDPELDQFMEAYCEMLAKYHEELTKPFHEAMLGLSKINSQLKALSVSPSYSGDDPCFFSNLSNTAMRSI